MTDLGTAIENACFRLNASVCVQVERENDNLHRLRMQTSRGEFEWTFKATFESLDGLKAELRREAGRCESPVNWHWVVALDPIFDAMIDQLRKHESRKLGKQW